MLHWFSKMLWDVRFKAFLHFTLIHLCILGRHVVLLTKSGTLRWFTDCTICWKHFHYCTAAVIRLFCLLVIIIWCILERYLRYLAFCYFRHVLLLYFAVALGYKMSPCFFLLYLEHTNFVARQWYDYCIMLPRVTGVYGIEIGIHLTDWSCRFFRHLLMRIPHITQPRNTEENKGVNSF